jgi:glycosyltransferase involved in cell wall biosynthesis
VRVLVWPAGDDNDATSQYRLLLPARILAAQGAEVVIDRIGPTVQWDQKWSGGEPPPWVNVMGLARRPNADVVVVQRPSRRWWSDLIPHLQARGIKVVCDVDDRFDQIDDGNIAKAAYATGRDSLSSHHWINEACMISDVVTCTTPALLKRYGFGHGVLLPNYVPESYLQVTGDRPETFGWAGSVATHPVDLQVTGGTVADVMRATGWGFHTVGTGEGVREALGLAEEPSTSRGWVPFDQYPAELAKMEVGVVPLAATAFNAAKSALKMGEMAAVGVPVVASPTWDNHRLHALGVGLEASNPQRWKKWLRALALNPDFRADVAGRGREVMAGLTYERHADEWWEAWTGTRRQTSLHVMASSAG